MFKRYPWLARALFWERNFPLPGEPDPYYPGYGNRGPDYPGPTPPPPSYNPGNPGPIPPPPSYNPGSPSYGSSGRENESDSNDDEQFNYDPGKVKEVPYEEIPFPNFDPLSPNQVLSGWRNVMARRRGKKEQWKQQELEIQKYSAETGAQIAAMAERMRYLLGLKEIAAQKEANQTETDTALMRMWFELLRSIFGGLGV